MSRKPRDSRSGLRLRAQPLVWVTLLAILCGVLYFGRWLEQGRRFGHFVSCRNHATFVAWGLDRYVAKHRALPHVPGLPGDELVCRLDFAGGLVNCHAGAPRQSYGGWQMVNASPEVWDAVLKAMRGKRIPVLWCGKSHRPGGRYRGEVRIVVTVDQKSIQYGSIRDLVTEHMKPDDPESFCYFRGSSIVYGMPEEELKENLAILNRILREHGEPETPLNIEGGKDYRRIAEPYQSRP